MKYKYSAIVAYFIDIYVAIYRYIVFYLTFCRSRKSFVMHINSVFSIHALGFPLYFLKIPLRPPLNT